MKLHQKGFTLIELMVIVAIIGILAAIAIPFYQNYIRKSQFAEVIVQTAAIKTSNELCMKEFHQTVGCSGGTNNVLADITPLNTTKYTLSVADVDGVITAIARGKDDSAAIAAATAAAGLPPAPTAIESVAPSVAPLYLNMNYGGSPLTGPFSTPYDACNYWYIAYSFNLYYSQNVSQITGPQSCGFTRLSDGYVYPVGWVLNTPAQCPTPASGSAYTFNPATAMCERPNPNPPAAPGTGNPGTALTNETYILNPTMDANGGITYTVGGTCLAAGLCDPQN